MQRIAALAGVVTLLTGALLLPADAQAQCSTADAPARALSALDRAYQALGVVRGMPARPVGEQRAAQIESLLRRQEHPAAMLVYAELDDTLCVFAFGPPGAAPIGLPLSASARAIEQQAGVLATTMGTDRAAVLRAPRRRGDPPAAPPSAMAPDAAAVAQLARDLGEDLIPAPIAARLAGASRLFVLPVRSIGTIPFAMVTDPTTGKPLVERLAVAVIPSITDISDRTPRLPGDWQRPLVVGNPDFGAETEWHLVPLPGAELEARSVAGLVRAAPLIGASATKPAVLDAFDGADLLYFATHGVADPAAPLDGSFLALAGGRLTPREIQHRRLPAARLAVLSACQTGLGLAHDAGIIGLSRAFILAGVPDVVMSLWSVDDDATAALMEAFVATAAQAPAPEALRSAMLAIRRDYPNPAQWAAFTVFTVQ